MTELQGPTRMPPSTCPSCGKWLDGAATIGESCEPPNPGDITLCIGCGTVMIFDIALKLRAATQLEIDTLPADERAHLQRASRRINLLRGARA